MYAYFLTWYCATGCGTSNTSWQLSARVVAARQATVAVVAVAGRRGTARRLLLVLAVEVGRECCLLASLRLT